jgi:hypothetical protein
MNLDLLFLIAIAAVGSYRVFASRKDWTLAIAWGFLILGAMGPPASHLVSSGKLLLLGASAFFLVVGGSVFLWRKLRAQPTVQRDGPASGGPAR